MRVIGVLEENKNGRSAYSWVEKRKDGFHLFTVEEHHCGGHYKHPVSALACDGRTYGDEYMEVMHSIPREDFELLVAELDLSDASRVILNGVVIDDPTVEDLLAVNAILGRRVGHVP